MVKGTGYIKAGLWLWDLHASFSKLSWKLRQNFTHIYFTQGNQETDPLYHTLPLETITDSPQYPWKRPHGI